MFLRKKTLGVRNNNPLNIRYSPLNSWKGQTGSNRGFCTFSTMDYGFRAALVLLRNYVRRGLNTPALIVKTWAPPNENDTDVYISKVGPWNPYAYKVSTLDDLCIICADMARVESCVDITPLEVEEIADRFDISF